MMYRRNDKGALLRRFTTTDIRSVIAHKRVFILSVGYQGAERIVRVDNSRRPEFASVTGNVRSRASPSFTRHHAESRTGDKKRVRSHHWGGRRHTDAQDKSYAVSLRKYSRISQMAATKDLR